MPNMFIGNKIKQIRENQRMSLTELSARSGVQIATLSRIENQKMTGTITSHQHIATALGVNLVELYQDTESLPDTGTGSNSQEGITQTFTYNNKATYEILASKLSNKRMLPIILKIEPDGQSNAEQGPRGSEKFIFVLSGQITVFIGEQNYELSTNSSLYFDASMKHYYLNSGAKPAQIISVSTPVTL